MVSDFISLHICVPYHVGLLRLVIILCLVKGLSTGLLYGIDRLVRVGWQLYHKIRDAEKGKNSKFKLMLFSSQPGWWLFRTDLTLIR